jgi:hypothetical protein
MLPIAFFALKEKDTFYEDFFDFENIRRNKDLSGFSTNQRLTRSVKCILYLFAFLKHRTAHEARRDLMRYVSTENREAAMIELDLAKQHCNITSRDVFAEIQFTDFMNRGGQDIPSWFTNSYQQAKILPAVMDIITARMNWLKCLIEDLTKPSCHQCSETVRRVIYAVLLSGAVDADTMDKTTIAVLCRVDNALNVTIDLQERIVKPMWKVKDQATDEYVSVPTLQNMEINQGVKGRHMFINCLGMNPSFLKDTENIQLTLLMIGYWYKNSSNSTLKHVVTLISCIAAVESSSEIIGRES